MTHSIRRLLPAAVALAGFALFAGTLAPGTVFGDPTEYTLVPHLWGILHPPGYAFMTLLVKLWQTSIPIGALACRTNLLSAARPSSPPCPSSPPPPTSGNVPCSTLPLDHW